MAIQGQTKCLLETILILILNMPQKEGVGKDRGHFPRKTFGTFLFRHRDPVVMSWNWPSLSVFSSMNSFSCILNECKLLISRIFLIKESHSLFTCSKFVLDHHLVVSFGYYCEPWYIWCVDSVHWCLCVPEKWVAECRGKLPLYPLKSWQSF